MKEIKIKEKYIKYFLAVSFAAIVGFFILIIRLSFLNEQSAWDTFIRVCNGISINCQEILYGSAQQVSNNKNLILIIGSALFSIFVFNLLIDIYKTNKYVKSFKVLKGYNLGRDIKIVKSNTFEAFTAGYINSKIYLSEVVVKKLSINELKAVVLHEQSHIKRFDNIKNLLLRSFRATFFFLPIIRDIEKIILQLNENTADKKVAFNMENGKMHVLSSLLKFSENIKTENVNVSSFANRNSVLLYEKENYYSVKVLNLLLSVLFILSSMLIIVRQNTFAQTLVETQCTAANRTVENMSIELPQSQQSFSCN